MMKKKDLRLKRQFKWIFVGLAGTVPAILPTGCARNILLEVSPFLIDGGNSILVEALFAVAPFVLP